MPLKDKIYTWDDLEKIATPTKWIHMYKHYSELLTQMDVGNFWQDQYAMANKERNELKNKTK